MIVVIVILIVGPILLADEHDIVAPLAQALVIVNASAQHSRAHVRVVACQVSSQDSIWVTLLV